MASLFHQNMRTFGGGSAPRNVTFNTAFAVVSGMTGQDYVAAGFTEISNPNAALCAQLLALAGQLDPGLTRLLVICVGSTALGTSEHIGIAWDPAYFTIFRAGQVPYDNLTQRWTCNAVVPPVAPNPPVIAIPGAAFTAVDSRGPAFIAGTYNGIPLIVMFMHNMYNLGDRSIGFRGLMSCAVSIRNAVGGAYAAARVYIGGDFNVLPDNVRKRRIGADEVLTYRAQRAGGSFVPTTKKHAYDFWLVSDTAGIPNASAEVYARTRRRYASDHAAIRLLMP